MFLNVDIEDIKIEPIIVRGYILITITKLGFSYTNKAVASISKKEVVIEALTPSYTKKRKDSKVDDVEMIDTVNNAIRRAEFPIVLNDICREDREELRKALGLDETYSAWIEVEY